MSKKLSGSYLQLMCIVYTRPGGLYRAFLLSLTLSTGIFRLTFGDRWQMMPNEAPEAKKKGDLRWGALAGPLALVHHPMGQRGREPMFARCLGLSPCRRGPRSGTGTARRAGGRARLPADKTNVVTGQTHQPPSYPDNDTGHGKSTWPKLQTTQDSTQGPLEHADRRPCSGTKA